MLHYCNDCKDNENGIFYYMFLNQNPETKYDVPNHVEPSNWPFPVRNLRLQIGWKVTGLKLGAS